MKTTQIKEISQKALQVFRRYCAQKKMRYTPERETIIKEIYSLNDHFKVDDLFLRLRAKNPNSRIAKTSIYRSVPYFLDAGLLRESIVNAGQTIYERTLGHSDHDHFRCVSCGRIVEFTSPDLVLAQKKLCSKEKFTVLWRTNVVNGYCQDCKDKKV